MQVRARQVRSTVPSHRQYSVPLRVPTTQPCHYINHCENSVTLITRTTHVIVVYQREWSRHTLNIIYNQPMYTKYKSALSEAKANTPMCTLRTPWSNCYRTATVCMSMVGANLTAP